jgi:hypothetical protein
MIRVDTGKDIVEELRGLIGYTHIGQYASIKHEVLERAIAEIQYLRGMAGAVTRETKDESFLNLRTMSRKPTIAELEAILKEDDRRRGRQS